MQDQETKLIQVFLSQQTTPGPAIYEVSTTQEGDIGEGRNSHPREAEQLGFIIIHFENTKSLTGE